MNTNGVLNGATHDSPHGVAKSMTSPQPPTPVDPRSIAEAERLMKAGWALGYRPQLPIMSTRSAEVLGWYFFQDAEVMRIHPDIKMPLSYVMGPLHYAEWEIEASSYAVALFAAKQLRWYWQNAFPSLQEEGYIYGWSAQELEYTEEDGYWVFANATTFNARDVTPMIMMEGQNRGRPVGVRVINLLGGKVDLWAWRENVPNKAIWYSHDPRGGERYGFSQIRPAWRHWRRLAGVDGIEEIEDIAAYRFGCGLVEVLHPNEKVSAEDSGLPSYGVNGTVHTRDIAQFIERNLKSGAGVALPSETWPTTTAGGGSRKWEVNVKSFSTNIGQLGEHDDRVARKCSKAIEVPPELFEAAQTGSGYSGRAIPLQGFLVNQQKRLNRCTNVSMKQGICPLVKWNFGPNAWVKATPRPLTESVRKSSWESPGDPESMVPQRPAQSQGVSLPPGGGGDDAGGGDGGGGGPAGMMGGPSSMIQMSVRYGLNGQITADLPPGGPESLDLPELLALRGVVASVAPSVVPLPRPLTDLRTDITTDEKSETPGIHKTRLFEKDGYCVYSVNACDLRSLGETDEEFCNYGIYCDFDEIPRDEIWVAATLVAEEGQYIIGGALARLAALKEREGDEEAYDIGIAVERELRKEHAKSHGEKVKYRGEDSTTEPPPSMYCGLFAVIPCEDDPVRVCLVDGCMIRDIYKTDFSQGGHHYVYPWVPKDEIWIEKCLDAREISFILEHERIERQLMCENGLDYDDAHCIASKVEWDLREKPVVVGMMGRRPRERSDQPLLFADTDDSEGPGVRHAGEGGQDVSGKEYKGGQFLPAAAEDPAQGAKPSKMTASQIKKEKRKAEKKLKEEEPETPLQTLAKVEKDEHERNGRLKAEADKLPDGTVVKGWKKVTLGEDVFWQKGKKHVIFLHKEVGEKAVREAVAKLSAEPTVESTAEPEEAKHELEQPSPEPSGLHAGGTVGADAGPAHEAELPGGGAGVREPEPVPELPPSPDGGGGTDVRGLGGVGGASDVREGRSAEGSDADAGGRTGTTDEVGVGGGDARGGEPSGRFPSEESLSQPPTPENPTDVSAGNWRYDSLDFMDAGRRQKLNDNIEAIRVLKTIEAEGRSAATPEEQAKLAKYVGWGQFPQAFSYYGNDEYEEEQNALKTLLTDEEYTAARKSTVNAHFTQPKIVDAHWKAAERLGFKGGRFLETSAGIGYYLGMMPKDIAARTYSSAVELDPTTGKIAELLYPSANVKVQGFQDFAAPDNFYDLIASNVPFAKEGIYDKLNPQYNKYNASLHDYFFLKSIDKVRPGGLVMHITSTGTMDGPDDTVRKALAEKADLVAAIRLPGGIHKGAGTDVVSDLVILRKRMPGESPTGGNWLETTTVPDPDGGEPIPVNRYFAENPDQILGRLDRTGTMYRGESVNVSMPEDFDARLEAAIQRLPAGAMSQDTSGRAQPQKESMIEPGETRIGGYAIHEGKVYHRDPIDGMVLQDLPEKTAERIQNHLEVRDAVRQVINNEINGQDSTEARAHLNAVYDDFVKKHGPLNLPANKKSFRQDPDSPVLLALEKWNSKTKTAEKADIFRQQTIRPDRHVESVGTVPEALGVSLHETGRVDIDRMASLTKSNKLAVSKHLVDKGLAYPDPEGGWHAADVYLSGNVRRKLALARAAAESDPTYHANVAALEKVQPDDIAYDEIGVKLGSPWVPNGDIENFAAEITGGREGAFRVGRNPATGEWILEVQGWGNRSLQGEKLYSTDRVEFKTLLDHALNNVPVIVKDTIGFGDNAKKVVNPEETKAAQDKINQLREKFKDWIWADDDRRNRLHRYYNDNFNNIRDIAYNGQHQTFPGMRAGYEIRPHIKDFVWQVVTTGRGLAAHEVGTGKTNSMIISAMELRRLGLAKKPAIACLKANVETITREAQELYPGAKIISTVDMFDAQNRKKTISQIATGDYDMVIMTHDNLDMLPMKSEVQVKYIQEELDDIREAILAAKEAAGSNKNDRVVKQLEKTLADREAKLQEALDSKKDNAVTFEETGIDSLFVDECFPGTTEVATDRGAMTIAEIVEHRAKVLVLSCNSATHRLEYKPVTSWFKRPLRNHLVRVTHEHGSFVCTPNHNIWTEEEGYVQAGLLQSHHSLRLLPKAVCRELGVSEQAATLLESVFRQDAVQADHSRLRVVQEAVYSTGEGWRREEEALQQSLCGSLAMVAEGDSGQSGRFDQGGSDRREAANVGRTDAYQQPDVRSRRSGTDAAINAWQDILGEGWQWQSDAAANPAGVRFGMDPGVCYRDCDGQGAIQVSAESLQGRSGPSALEDRGRNRRPQPQAQEVEVSRQEKDGSSVRSRVVSVAIHQRKGDERTCDGGVGDCYVYDIEVSGNHNYFANGVNVSNSHKYKSLPVYTRQRNVKGIPSSMSDRAANMLMRTRWLMENNGGRGVVFVTGTPVANTMAELYNMQRYLQPQELRERGLQSFDAWAATFGDIVTELEPTVTGDYKATSRFRRFVNLPELMQISRQVMDVQRADDLLDAEGNPVVVRPERHDHAVTSPETPAMTALMEDLKERAEKLKAAGGRAVKGGDNMLVITNDGRKGAVDMRLVVPGAEDDPSSKTNQTVAKVLEISKANPGTTQLIFSDIGVHPDEKTGFHLYGDIIDKLVAGGIPRDKIADFSGLEGKKKEDAQEALRQGEILVALGGTDKLGTGVNVQRKLKAVHHLDVPYVPASIEQRDGRIWRSGNTNKNIDIYRYVAEKSIDEFLWRLVSNKAGFIKQAMKPAKHKLARHVTEIDTEQLSPDELMAIASGEPLLFERVQLQEDVKQLRDAKDRHEREKYRLTDKATEMESNIRVKQREADSMQGDIDELAKRPDFEVKIGDTVYDKRPEATTAINALLEKPLENRYRDEHVGYYRGFEIIKKLGAVGIQGKDNFYPTGPSLGSIEAVARRLGERREGILETIQKTQDAIKRIREAVGGGDKFKGEDELAKKVARLAEIDAHLEKKNKKEEEEPTEEPEPPKE